MDRQRNRKLNRLQHILPDGLLADAAWLEERGYSSALRSKYVANGWLIRPARGVFARPSGPQRWEQVVISLQSILNRPATVGGRTALALHGFGHYLALGGDEIVELYTEASLPGWLTKIELDSIIRSRRSARLFPMGTATEAIETLPDPTAAGTLDVNIAIPGGLMAMPWGPHSWPLLMSSPERAALEFTAAVNERPFH